MNDQGPRKRNGRLYQKLLRQANDDPLSTVANLFDISMVFAVALLLALFSAVMVPELVTSSDELTIVKNPGRPDMEIIMKKGVKIDRYRATNQEVTGRGQRLGVAYRLPTGDVVYVPEKRVSANQGK
jgi:hypothetical protein